MTLRKQSTKLYVMVQEVSFSFALAPRICRTSTIYSMSSGFPYKTKLKFKSATTILEDSKISFDFHDKGDGPY